MSGRLRFTALALILSSNAVAATSGFSEPQRLAYIGKAVRAIRESPKQALDNLNQFLSLQEQGRCHSGLESLAVSCLEEEAKRNCESGSRGFRLRCPILSDIAVVNKLNEKHFVSRDERLDLMRRAVSGNFRSIYSRIVMRKYAMLASELLLTSKEECGDQDNDCLTRELDRYCMQNSDVKNIPWQACVGAIVWFIGTAK